MNFIEEYERKYHHDPKAFAKKLEERTTIFAVNIIKLSAKLPDSSE